MTVQSPTLPPRPGLPPWFASFLPILAAIVVGFVVSGLVAYAVGQSPMVMLRELILGAFVGPQFGETVARAVPLVGMTLCAALPLRAGMVNLGGDGQLVLGGCAAAMIALYLPIPEGPRIVAALVGGALVGGAYASLAAFGENYAHVPMLISSWLLSYPAKSFCSFLVRTDRFHDPDTAWPATYRITRAMRLTPLFEGAPITQGFILIAVLAALVIFMDRRSTVGFEIRMRGLNERFARYGGVALNRQTVMVMFASGAVAGLVGGILVLGSQYRFTDGALTAPQYGWSGMLAALLAGGEPVAAVTAGFLFAALQTGGFAMERSVQIPRVLTMVLESVIILFLSMRGAIGRRSS
jgi:general nucleoside transport system permease protein